MLYNRCTGIYKFGNNTYPRRVRRRSNLGHIFGEKSASYGLGNTVTLHVAQVVNTEQLQHCIYCSDMVCFRYTIVNTLHKGDDDDDDNNNNKNFMIYRVSQEECEILRESVP